MKSCGLLEKNWKKRRQGGVQLLYKIWYHALENATNHNTGKPLDDIAPNPPIVNYAYVLCVNLETCSADVFGIIFAHRRPKFTTRLVFVFFPRF